jgi:hypothetical protein
MPHSSIFKRYLLQTSFCCLSTVHTHNKIFVMWKYTVLSKHIISAHKHYKKPQNINYKILLTSIFISHKSENVVYSCESKGVVYSPLLSLSLSLCCFHTHSQNVHLIGQWQCLKLYIVLIGEWNLTVNIIIFLISHIHY